MNLIRLILLVVFSLSSFGAVDNRIWWQELSGSNQTNLPNRARVWFFPGQVPPTKWVRPFPGGTGATTWQAHQLTFYTSEWCAAFGYSSSCSGSVQSMQVFWVHDVTGNATVDIPFRLSDVPCSGGSTTEAQCTSAGLTLGGFLSAWPSGEDVTMEYTTTGASGVTYSQSVRSMLSDNNACIVYAGPAVTILDIGWATGSGHNCSPITTRPYAFGFAQKRVMHLSSQVDTSVTSWPIHNHSEVAGLSYPQAAWADDEKVNITAATATSLTVQRAQGGTSAAFHSGQIYLTDGKPLLAVAFNPTNANQFTVDDASTISAGDVVRIRETWHRTCAKTSNTLTLGHAAVSCAVDNFHQGRDWYGSRGHYGDVPIGYPVFKFSDDQWITATASAQKSLSPRAFAYKWTGRNGIGVQLVTMNTWEDRKQNQVYNFVVKIGATTVATRNIVHHLPYSMQVYPDGIDFPTQGTYTSDGFLWTSNTPGEGFRDHNTPWLRAVGAFQIDPGEVFDTTGYNHFFTGTETLGNGQVRPGWDNSNKASMSVENWGDAYPQRVFDSFWVRDEGGGGSYGGLGEMCSWCAGGLRLMAKRGILANANRWTALVYGAAISGFHVPIYAHSVSTSGTFCGDTAQGTTQEPGASCSTPAFQSVIPFGRPMFSDHSPTFTAVTITSGIGVGRITNGGWTHNYSFGSAHWFNYFSLPYTLQADPLWKMGLEANTASAHTFTYFNNPFNASATGWFDLFRQSRSKSGIAYNSSGVRGSYITIRMLGLGAALLPSSPEKEIILKKYINNLAVREGAFGMTGGNFFNSCTTPKDCSFYTFGKFTRGWDSVTNASIPMVEGPASCSLVDTGVNGARVYYPTKPFMYLYLPLGLKWHMGLGLHQGLPLYRHSSRVAANTALNSAAHGTAGTSLGIMTAYGSPDVTMLPEGVDSNCAAQGSGPPLGTNPAFTNWANYFFAWDSTTKSPSFKGLTDEYPNLTRDRIFLYRASLGGDHKTTVEDLSLRKAWEVVSIRARNSNATAGNTAFQTGINFRLSPDWWHNLKAVTIIPATTTARIVFERPTTATSCSYNVGTSLSVDQSDSGDTSATTTKLEHIFNLTGLTSATLYYLRLQCEDASEERIGRWYGTFTTQ